MIGNTQKYTKQTNKTTQIRQTTKNTKNTKTTKYTKTTKLRKYKRRINTKIQNTTGNKTIHQKYQNRPQNTKKN